MEKDLKLSFILKHEITGEFQERVFDYIQLFKGYVKKTMDHLADDGFVIVAIREYIGMQDKNKREIFEDDIVVAWSEGSRGIFLVKWRPDGSPMYILYPAYQEGRFWNLSGSKDTSNGGYHDTVEVVGNIHMNPDRMKDSHIRFDTHHKSYSKPYAELEHEIKKLKSELEQIKSAMSQKEIVEK